MCDTVNDIQVPKYKIHGIDTVRGLVPSAETKKFYDSYDEALAAATRIVTRASAPDGIFIFQAIAFVEKEAAPVRVTKL